jgi:rhodanese-related sulfurtransferase
MIAAIKKLLGIGPKADLAEVISRGAVIVDVRSTGEYAGGHVKGSLNIPLNALPSQMQKLKKDKPVITCCASGMRSASARSMLLSNGFTEVYNGGGWMNLKRFEK